MIWVGVFGFGVHSSAISVRMMSSGIKGVEFGVARLSAFMSSPVLYKLRVDS